MILQRNQDIVDLKSKMAEVMALLPSVPTSYANSNSDSPSPHFSANFTNKPEDDVLSKSSLNPNASDYTPMHGGK